MEWLASWGPMLLLVGVWMFFMWRMQQWRRGAGPQEHMAELKRHNDTPEKILASHEDRLQRLEANRRG